MGIDEKLLDSQLEFLEKSRSWSPRVIAKLESVIRSGDDYSLFRINPIRFAKEKGISENETIDLFLWATKSGLFVMDWILTCPRCGDTVESFKNLQNVHSHFYCHLCRKEAEASLDDFIQVNFTIDPSIREIIFHDPRSLSIEDFQYKYHYSPEGRIPGGPIFIEIAKQIQRFLSHLKPGETIEAEIDLIPGFIVGNDLLNNLDFAIEIDTEDTNDQQTISIEFSNGIYKINKTRLCLGKAMFRITNNSSEKSPLALYSVPTDFFTNMAELEFSPFLTGKKLLNMQTFRNLFRNEVVSGAEGLSIKELTILFTDLKGSTELYERIGDLKAFSLVQQHFDYLEKAISSHSGAIVKTIGDAIMATFLNPLDAIEAALEMLNEIESFSQRLHKKELILKIGIHKGASIAVTLNDRLDYFGQSVNIAARVQNLADSEEICITNEVYSDPGVQKILSNKKVSSDRAKLKGLQNAIKVYTISK